MRRPITAFVSYSHRDAGPQAELRTHLAGLERQGHLYLWNDERILAGDDWSPRISESRERSQIVLVLLSPDYLASDACQRELERALELRVARDVRVLPIVLRTCDWASTRLAGIQLARGMSTDLPLADLPPGDRRDRAFQTIVERVKPVLRDLGATLGVDAAFDLDLAPFDFEAHRRYLADQRRLGKTPLAADLLRGLAPQRSLLRVPLFLRMVLDLAPRDPERALKRLGNRSGLVKDYAEYLLSWNQATASRLGESDVRGALMQVARLLQIGGQHVREEDLRRRIEAPHLEEALRRGVLVRDEGYIRFFHQILQEHFCAAALVDDWRRRRRTIRRLPRKLRRALTKPAMLEVASHVIAIADDDEAGVLLDDIAARDQALLLRWLDDVCADSPPRVEIGPALTQVRRSCRRGLWFSRVPFIGRDTTNRRDRFVRLALRLYVAAVAGAGIAGGLQEPLQLGDGSTAGIGALVAILLGSLIGWTFVPAGRAAALLVAAREARSASLRQELMVSVAEAAGSRLANPSLQGLAASLLGMREHDTPAEILSSSVAPYAAIRLLAYDPSRLAFHLLARLLAHDNCFGLAALRALDVRAERFPRERVRKPNPRRRARHSRQRPRRRCSPGGAHTSWTIRMVGGRRCSLAGGPLDVLSPSRHYPMDARRERRSSTRRAHH